MSSLPNILKNLESVLDILGKYFSLVLNIKYVMFSNTNEKQGLSHHILEKSNSHLMVVSCQDNFLDLIKDALNTVL